MKSDSLLVAAVSGVLSALTAPLSVFFDLRDYLTLKQAERAIRDSGASDSQIGTKQQDRQDGEVEMVAVEAGDAYRIMQHLANGALEIRFDKLTGDEAVEMYNELIAPERVETIKEALAHFDADYWVEHDTY